MPSVPMPTRHNIPRKTLSLGHAKLRDDLSRSRIDERLLLLFGGEADEQQRAVHGIADEAADAISKCAMENSAAAFHIARKDLAIRAARKEGRVIDRSAEGVHGARVLCRERDRGEELLRRPLHIVQKLPKIREGERTKRRCCIDDNGR